MNKPEFFARARIGRSPRYDRILFSRFFSYGENGVIEFFVALQRFGIDWIIVAGLGAFGQISQTKARVPYVQPATGIREEAVIIS